MGFGTFQLASHGCFVHARALPLEVDVLPSESDKLAGTHTAKKGQLEVIVKHRFIFQVAQDGFGLFERERIRRLFLHFGVGQMLGGIVFYPTVAERKNKRLPNNGGDVVASFCATV